MFITHPLYAYAILLFIALSYLGRRYLSFFPVSAAFGTVEAWAQALGATISRWVARVIPELGDRIGAYVSALFVLGLWAILSWALAQVLSLP